MILRFKCERLHYFLNSHYDVVVYKDKITIGNSTVPKYEYQLTLKNTLYWFIDSYKLQAFGIEWKGKIKFFKAHSKDLEHLRNMTKNMILFDNIVEFYKQIDTNNPSKVQDQFNLQLYNIQCVTAEFIQNQASIIMSLNHPGIITYRECFKYKEKHYMISEYISGISLQNLLLQNQQLSHLDCQKIILMLFKIIKYLHDHYVTGFTIDLETIFYKSDSIKLTDFTNTIKSNLIKNSDIQQCGKIMFRLYTGKNCDDEDHFSNMNVLFDTQTPQLAQELIMSMITSKPISIYEALQHPYFQNTLNSKEKRNRFQKFKRTQRSTTDIDDGDGKTQLIPEFHPNKSKSLKQFT